VSQLEFADELAARIAPHTGRYHPRAFLFVLAALEYVQQRLPERRHVSGEELSHACRELAIAEYGLLARDVLAHWGIHATSDFGEIVYALVDAGLLIRRPEDRPEDFREVYAFSAAFETEYPWGRDVMGGGDEVMT
jgi:uncharacterized repeat protein (TIGR04138 family)